MPRVPKMPKMKSIERRGVAAGSLPRIEHPIFANFGNFGILGNFGIEREV
jgi:hypothetical protein